MRQTARSIAYPENSTHSSQAPAVAAMISESARSGLIARRSFDAPANGLSDEQLNRMKPLSISAGKRPQTCGKNTPSRFNVLGMMAWLRKQHPKSTIHEVSARTGIPAASVENWLHGRSKPSVQHFSLIIAVYGAGAFAACFDAPPDWLKTATALQREQEIDDEIERLQMERRLCRGSF